MLYGCAVTRSLVNVGAKREWAESYDSAYVYDDKLYLSYEMKGDNPGVRNVSVRIYDEHVGSVKEVRSFPDSISLSEIDIVNYGEGVNEGRFECPLVVNYFESYGYNKYKYKSCDSSSHQLFEIPSPPARGDYLEWWNPYVVVIGFFPAVVIDLIALPFIAPEFISNHIED